MAAQHPPPLPFHTAPMPPTAASLLQPHFALREASLLPRIDLEPPHSAGPAARAGSGSGYLHTLSNASHTPEGGNPDRGAPHLHPGASAATPRPHLALQAALHQLPGTATSLSRPQPALGH